MSCGDLRVSSHAHLDVPVASGPRRDRRGHARRRQDRHDPQGHRAGVRRQGAAGGDPRRRGARARIVSRAVAERARRREHADRTGGWRADRRRRRRRPFRRTRREAGAVRERHGRPVARARWRAVRSSCSKAPRRRSSISTTAPIRTSRRRTRRPGGRASAPASGRATSTASSGSRRPTRPGWAPGRSRPSCSTTTATDSSTSAASSAR